MKVLIRMFLQLLYAIGVLLRCIYFLSSSIAAYKINKFMILTFMQMRKKQFIKYSFIWNEKY